MVPLEPAAATARTRHWCSSKPGEKHGSGGHVQVSDDVARAVISFRSLFDSYPRAAGSGRRSLMWRKATDERAKAQREAACCRYYILTQLALTLALKRCSLPFLQTVRLSRYDRLTRSPAISTR